MADVNRTFNVEFKGDTSDLHRAARRAKDDLDDVGRSVSRNGDLIGKGATAALKPFVDNDIAVLIGGQLAALGPMFLAATGSVAVFAGALAGVVAIGVGAGAVLGGVAAWLYKSDPNSPMAKAVDEVKDEFEKLKTTLRNAIQPAFDDLANVFGPMVIDLFRQLKDWIVNNKAMLREWAFTLAKSFLDSVIVISYFGQALVVLSTGAIATTVVALGGLTAVLGTLYQGLGFVTGNKGLQNMGSQMRTAGTDAVKMSDDIVRAGTAAYGGLGKIRDGATDAKKKLDAMEGDYLVTAEFRASWNPAWQRMLDAGVVPHMPSRSGSHSVMPVPGAPMAGTRTTTTALPTQVVTINISGAIDEEATARRIRDLLRRSDVRLGIPR